MLNANKILALLDKEDYKTIKLLCKQEILEESAKSHGGDFLVRIKAAQKMLKALNDWQLGKLGAHRRKTPAGVIYQNFNNSHYGFMLYEALPGLPLADPEKAIDIKKFIDKAEKDFSDRQEQNIDIELIKAHIKEYKALNKGRKVPAAYYDIKERRYNAQYIVDCYTILGGDIKFYQDDNCLTNAAILESENGKAILLPVRKNNVNAAVVNQNA